MERRGSVEEEELQGFDLSPSIAATAARHTMFPVQPHAMHCVSCPVKHAEACRNTLKTDNGALVCPHSLVGHLVNILKRVSPSVHTQDDEMEEYVEEEY
jgi:hypothetical protein